MAIEDSLKRIIDNNRQNREQWAAYVSDLTHSLATRDYNGIDRVSDEIAVTLEGLRDPILRQDGPTESVDGPDRSESDEVARGGGEEEHAS